MRDLAIQVAIRDFALERVAGARLIRTFPSPIAGAEGNREYLMDFRKLYPADPKLGTGKRFSA